MKKSSALKDWTIMVYISADDVLANFAVEALKQLKRAAGDGVAVVAQFDANQKQAIRRYVFEGDGHKESSLESSRRGKSIPSPINSADPKRLRDFIDFATWECPAKHYMLVPNGHGPELLLDDQLPIRTPGPNPAYFTPSALREALEATHLGKAGAKNGESGIDILAIDACSMSMVEAATELQKCVGYLIASQEDVPDAGFPYEQIVHQLRPFGVTAVDICNAIPKIYKDAFHDYIFTPENGLKGVTLSSLSLKQIESVTTPLRELAKCLLLASHDPVTRKKIISARGKSQDFDYGLFVDLFDFCQQVETAVASGALKTACKKVREAIEGPASRCVIQNQSIGKNAGRNHGLSIYLPYHTPDLTEDFSVWRATKNGTNHPTKNGTNHPTKNGTNHPTKERANRILELERDFALLEDFGRTGWLKFIKQGWSYMLAKEEAGQLDEHYSAQQCAENLVSAMEERKGPSHAGRGPAIASLNGSQKKARLLELPSYRDQRQIV